MRLSLNERFVGKIQKGGLDDCWPWLAGCDADGYGRFKVGHWVVKAHRMAYELFKGKIPAGLQIRHSCDNPPCCNPAHLLLGTNFDNMRDKIERGRQGIENISKALKGKPFTSPHLSALRKAQSKWRGKPARYVPPRKLTDDQLDNIAARYAKGETAEVLACEFNVSGRAILSWMRRKGVKRLSGYGTGKSSGTHGNKGRSHPGRVYSPEEIERYREMRRQWWAKRKGTDA